MQDSDILLSGIALGVTGTLLVEQFGKSILSRFKPKELKA